MEPRELERSLKRQELGPVLLLWGEESLLIDEAIQRIEAIAFDAATRDFNRHVYYGDEAEAQAILTTAQTLPWLASRRLVLVREPEALPRSADNLLITYCKQPSPSTCLIFTAQKIDLSRSLFATLARMAWAVRFRHLPPRELSAWVERRIHAGACKVTADAVSTLIGAVGNDLRMLANEIDKLVTFVGTGRGIDVTDVLAVTADVREASAFELARLLSARELAGALHAWERLSASGEYPGMALGAILHHLRQLLRIKLAQLTGSSLERIADELNIPTFMARRLAAQATTLEPDRLRRWFEALLEADQTLKRSGLPPQTVFEALILRLCLEDGPAHSPA